MILICGCLSLHCWSCSLTFLPMTSHFISSSCSVHHAYKSIPLFSNVSPFSFLAILHKLCVQRVPTCYIYTNHPTPVRTFLAPTSHITSHPIPPPILLQGQSTRLVGRQRATPLWCHANPRRRITTCRASYKARSIYTHTS